eukprot:190050-Rhodomonas_salina.1
MMFEEEGSTHLLSSIAIPVQFTSATVLCVSNVVVSHADKCLPSTNAGAKPPHSGQLRCAHSRDTANPSASLSAPEGAVCSVEHRTAAQDSNC